MDIGILIEKFKSTNSFSDDDLLEIRATRALRLDLIEYFKVGKDRHFALSLLDKFIELRKDPKNEISIDDLMLAGFIVGMHKHVEDSLKIWEAKRVDFDAYCGVDIQLLPFAGVEQTIIYLKTQTGTEAKEALAYVTACADGGDFDELEGYYNSLPWWV